MVKELFIVTRQSPLKSTKENGSCGWRGNWTRAWLCMVQTGAEVTVVEFLPEICPQLDADVSKVARRILEKHGLTFSLSTKVSGCKTGKNGVVLTVEKRKNLQK